MYLTTMSHHDLNQLRTELKTTNGQIATLTQELGDAETEDKAAIQQQLDEAMKTKEDITVKVVEFLESEEHFAPPPIGNISEPAFLTGTHDSEISIDITGQYNSPDTRDPGFAPALPRREHLTRMRVQQPKEFKKGDDFSTFSYRYKIFVESACVPKNMQANLLLNNVDNETLQKLAPVVENLTDSEKEDLTTLLARCHEELYPLSEVRALRQQLTAGCTKQEEDEDVDTFASRLRSIANRAAYTRVSERSEACLNAFLHGVNDELYDKILATPGAENDFEIAVSAGRKFEKMKRTRTPTSQVDNQLAVLRINESSRTENLDRPERSRGSRDMEPNPPSRSQSHHNRDVGSGTNQGSRFRRTDRPNTGDYSRRNRTETRTCFRCRQVGHIARNCNANLEHLN